jgi:arsenite methyltransferase
MVEKPMRPPVRRSRLQRAGFADIWVGGHQPFGIDQAALYPHFTPEVIQVMRQTIPADHQDHVATGVIVKARKPVESTSSRPKGLY